MNEYILTALIVLITLITKILFRHFHLNNPTKPIDHMRLGRFYLILSWFNMLDRLIRVACSIYVEDIRPAVRMLQYRAR